MLSNDVEIKLQFHVSVTALNDSVILAIIPLVTLRIEAAQKLLRLHFVSYLFHMSHAMKKTAFSPMRKQRRRSASQ